MGKYIRNRFNKKICQKKITLIEDAAEMIGHEYKKKKCGFYGDLSIILCQQTHYHWGRWHDIN